MDGDHESYSFGFCLQLGLYHDVVDLIQGPLCLGLVVHCTSGRPLNPPLLGGPADCKKWEISGVSQGYSVGGSSDATCRCQFCVKRKCNKIRQAFGTLETDTGNKTTLAAMSLEARRKTGQA